MKALIVVVLAIAASVAVAVAQEPGEVLLGAGNLFGHFPLTPGGKVIGISSYHLTNTLMVVVKLNEYPAAEYWRFAFIHEDAVELISNEVSPDGVVFRTPWTGSSLQMDLMTLGVEERDYGSFALTYKPKVVPTAVQATSWGAIKARMR